MVYTFTLEANGTFRNSLRVHRTISEQEFQRYSSDKEKDFIRKHPETASIGDRYYAKNEKGEWIGTVCIWKTSNHRDYTADGLPRNGYALTSDLNGLIDLFEQWFRLSNTPPAPVNPLDIFEIWD